VENSAAAALRAYLAPVMSGLAEPGPAVAADAAATGSAPAHDGPAPEHAGPAPALPRPGITLGEYVDMVRAMADAVAAPAAKHPNRVRGWLARLAVLGRRQRAYGPEERLASWTGQRGLQLREIPLPA